MRLLLSSVFLFFGFAINAQISGTVKGLEGTNQIPLPGANVFWEGTNIGAITNAKGEFTIAKPANASKLIASFIGYKAASKLIISRKGLTHFLLEPAGEELNTVEIIGEASATTVDLNRPELSYQISSKELRKAACCNLSESFETNATVDVSFADAVTGTKHIEMLGLAGRYALIQRENIPFARGINSSTGFTFIPGPFVESIQLTKGLSSVLNGYESLSGQINVEFLKPENAPKLMLNLFGNEGGRMEGNIVSAFQVNPTTSSEILFHYSNTPFVNDHNDDGFADMPIGDQLNLTNKWHFGRDGKGWEGQVAFTAISDKKEGGQVDFLDNNDVQNNSWGYSSENQRLEVFGKAGYVFENDLDRSIGLIFSANDQERSAVFGERNYLGKQQSLYFNSIFQDGFINTEHKFKTGLSFQLDVIEESLSGSILSSSVFFNSRKEYVPGAYFEYTYQPDNKLTLVGGLRADYNSYFKKTFVTPRANIKYSVTENTTFRLGGGRGQRTPNVLIEHFHSLASNRNLVFQNGEDPQAEIGWNAGFSVNQNIRLKEKLVKFNVDIFYTWFENKLIGDVDFDPTTILFLYNSGSNSLSLFSQVDFELVKNLDLRLAYKYLNAQENFEAGLNQNYLIPKHRSFANLSYETEKKWKFDFTVNWYGEKRLPSTELHPNTLKIKDVSEDFITVNFQMNKELKNGLELFVGADNLFNYQQNSDPILSVDNTSSPYFDTNYAWGPIFGRNIYAGLYYTFK